MSNWLPSVGTFAKVRHRLPALLGSIIAEVFKGTFATAAGLSTVGMTTTEKAAAYANS